MVATIKTAVKATAVAPALLGSDGDAVETMAAEMLEWRRQNCGNRKGGRNRNGGGAGFAWKQRQRGGDNGGSKAGTMMTKRRIQERRRRQRRRGHRR